MNLKKSILFLITAIDRKNKIKLFFFLILTLFSSMAEILSLGLLIPFLSFFFEDSREISIDIISSFLFKINSFFSDSNEPNLAVVSLLLIFFFLLASVIRILTIYFSIKISNSISVNFGEKLFRNTLNRDFSYFKKNNSNDLLSLLTNKLGSVNNVIFSSFLLISSSIVGLFIILSIIILEPYLTTITFFFIAVGYLIAIIFSKNILKINSIHIFVNDNKVIKSINEGINGIRDIILTNSSHLFVKKYQNFYKDLLRYHGFNRFIQQFPKFVLETIAVIIIILIALFFSNYKSGSNIITSLGIIAFASHRLLPLAQQLYNGIASIYGSKESIIIVSEGLKTMRRINSTKIKKLVLKKKIILSSISYKFQKDENYLFKSSTIEIKKGDIIGIIGNSGSGKSTFIDILVGLLKPTNGNIYMDGTKINSKNKMSYLSNFSVVYQNIYLIDDTILKNIAFGQTDNDIDKKKAENCANLVGLGDVLKKEAVCVR